MQRTVRRGEVRRKTVVAICTVTRAATVRQVESFAGGCVALERNARALNAFFARRAGDAVAGVSVRDADAVNAGLVRVARDAVAGVSVRDADAVNDSKAPGPRPRGQK